MTNHPYPEHVVEAVQKQMDWAGATAQVALQALWDASRVDSIEQLESVPDFASLVDGEGFTYRTYELRNPKVFPVNIIYWGDTDE